MPKPITPLCGCEVFVTDSQDRVLLIRRSDNNLWALPGGSQELTETTAECAARECFEESGLKVEIENLLGVWSSIRYEYINYPWKDDVFTHIVFRAKVVGGVETTSSESNEVAWFSQSQLPALSDGHEPRIQYCFKWLKEPSIPPYFE